MPSLNDVLEVAELLKSKPVIVAEERCVAVRNRNASCRKCEAGCLAGCIEVGQNSLSIDAGACVNCGACVTICPTGALVGLDPVEEDLVTDTVAAWVRAKEVDQDAPVVLSCARAAAWKQTDPALHGTVACLGRVSEATLVALLRAVDAAAPIVLVDGVCATCKFGTVSPLVDEACAGAETLTTAFGVAASIERVSAFPDAVRLAPGEKGSSLRGRERRSLISDAKRFAASAAQTAAEKAIADALHQQKPGEPTLRDRLKVNPHGALPTFTADRNLAVLDALCDLASESAPSLSGSPTSNPSGLPSDEPDRQLDTRLFGEVSIDAETCTGCGMCAMFCPTGALRFSEVAEPAEEDMRYLEFQAADCTHCLLCADVCLHDSVVVTSQVRLCDLLDFEPRLIAVPKPKKSVDIFKSARKARSSHGSA